MIYLFGGGTISHVRSHLALCAPAYGTTVRKVSEHLLQHGVPHRPVFTRMADPDSRLETNEDVATALREVLADSDTSGIFFNVALCDYVGEIDGAPSGKYAARLASRAGQQSMTLRPADKLLGQIKATRPDILVIGSKTTANAPAVEQIQLSHRQIQETGVDYVLANDTVSRQCFLVSELDAISLERRQLVARLAALLSEKEVVCAC